MICLAVKYFLFFLKLIVKLLSWDKILEDFMTGTAGAFCRILLGPFSLAERIA